MSIEAILDFALVVIPVNLLSLSVIR